MQMRHVYLLRVVLVLGWQKVGAMLKWRSLTWESCNEKTSFLPGDVQKCFFPQGRLLRLHKVHIWCLCHSCSTNRYGIEYGQKICSRLLVIHVLSQPVKHKNCPVLSVELRLAACLIFTRCLLDLGYCELLAETLRLGNCSQPASWPRGAVNVVE